MNSPNEEKIYMGLQSAALIFDQERKHWLMKTDKKKYIQDKTTGNKYVGKVDNLGVNIDVSTSKLPDDESYLSDIKFNDMMMDDILSIQTSTLPYSSSVNGLLFAGIKSINYQYQVGNSITYKNYKLQMTNCEIVKIPFVSSGEVYVTEWLKTNTPPSLLIYSNDQTVSRSLQFKNTTTNVVYYYPYSETLQPIQINESNGVYVTNMINDNSFIGYPLFWFTCDQSNIGPTTSFTNNDITDGHLLYVSNDNQSKYIAKIYTNIDGNLYGTPSNDSISNYQIRISCKNTYTFANGNIDEIPLDPSSLTFIDTVNNNEYNVGITLNPDDTLYLDPSAPWVCTSQDAIVLMSAFASNSYSLTNNTPLIPMLTIHFDESIPFTNTTTDVGYAGVNMNTSNQYSDTLSHFPFNLNKWSGLPTWLMDSDENVNQHLVIYAIHDTPTSSEEAPETRQTAALLFEPGLPKTDNSELTNDERGRVYYLSNDPCEYDNNKTSENPKPDRTIARICDVPTSVMQLSNISGLSPTAVVDKKYVRSETSYNIEDKSRLYNDITSRFVLPTALDKNGIPITDREEQTNTIIFNSADLLRDVDLFDHNEFREYTNLNPVVNAQDVELGLIYEHGESYDVGDIGIVVVGGFAFNYTVTEIDTNGGVTNLLVTPSHEYEINLSNFDMDNDNIASTQPYGTSPITGSGHGLKFSFHIINYESHLMKKGDVFDDLFALVKDPDGLWLYQYDQPAFALNDWARRSMISENGESSTSIEGNLSVKDVILNTTIPSLHSCGISLFDDGEDPTTVNAFVTSSFVNIIDQDKTPVEPIPSQDPQTQIQVDMCKYYCDGLIIGGVDNHLDDEVYQYFEKHDLFRHDGYICWRWLNDTDNQFIFGFISRSFNNYLSNDITTTLPRNELYYKKYVHTNPNTTVVWNVKGIGPMMWMYDPSTNIREKYILDPNTVDISVEHKPFSWEDIDFRNNIPGTQDEYPPLVDPDTKLFNYNILTNNSYILNKTNPSNQPVYQQLKYEQIDSLRINASSIDAPSPCGNWILVFPRVDEFTFTDDTSGVTYTPARLQLIRTSNMTNINSILDQNNNDVRRKTMIVDQNRDGVSLKVYNADTNTWFKV